MQEPRVHSCTYLSIAPSDSYQLSTPLLLSPQSSDASKRKPPRNPPTCPIKPQPLPTPLLPHHHQPHPHQPHALQLRLNLPNLTPQPLPKRSPSPTDNPPTNLLPNPNLKDIQLPTQHLNRSQRTQVNRVRIPRRTSNVQRHADIQAPQLRTNEQRNQVPQSARVVTDHARVYLPRRCERIKTIREDM